MNAPAIVTPLIASAAAPAPTTTWALADEGLWVATHAGYFGGTIDQHGAHHYAMDTFGRYVGDFATLDLAKQHLIEHMTTLFGTEGMAA
ncbi:hypothetical protein DEI92_05725 [Curtobacterium sp. MCBD17_034]|uniref:hypothetical protein n=1 Tax=unclassified Curtobacterium TaxID=257496 RepID=UPI000DA70708|nr:MULTISPECIES: hypothetical protein [unclassified Curtobacterium]PZF61101.1 hypothetical protein DEI92_05725 [Curtobacterium sp. MCBD17_034]PZM40451.1 hypothetical protein DEI90_01960 [Curtobacterium sp. MCBD17_031]